ncbi:MAG: hypothetical protein FWD59_01480 [Micrococcales bacterium]|nr:hypothetical protein [Micrococcales bacterium]
MTALRKMLGAWDDAGVQALVAVLETQSKETIARWGIACSRERYLPVFEAEVPGDLRPREALAAAEAWLAREVRLPAAKPAILACHAAAREAEGLPAAQAAARAIGQAASVIHAPTHCMGLVFYGAAAFAYSTHGVSAAREVYDQAAEQEFGVLLAALTSVAVADEPNPAKLNWRC